MYLTVTLASPLALREDLLRYTEDNNLSFLKDMANYDQTILTAGHVSVCRLRMCVSVCGLRMCVSVWGLRMCVSVCGLRMCMSVCVD